MRHVVGEGVLRLAVVREAGLEEVGDEPALDGLAALARDRLAVHVRLERAETGHCPVRLLHVLAVRDRLHEAGRAVFGLLLPARVLRTHLRVGGGNPRGAVPVLLLEEACLEESLRGLEPRAFLVLHLNGPHVLLRAPERGAAVLHGHGLPARNLAGIPHQLLAGESLEELQTIGRLRRTFACRFHVPAEHRCRADVRGRDELVRHQSDSLRIHSRLYRWRGSRFAFALLCGSIAA